VPATPSDEAATADVAAAIAPPSTWMPLSSSFGLLLSVVSSLILHLSRGVVVPPRCARAPVVQGDAPSVPDLTPRR
jgi:hypothetical protein